LNRESATRESVERALTTQYQGLQRLIRRKIQNPDDAADLLNAALVVTLEHFDAGRISEASHVGGYVYQVAMNLLKNHRRKHVERSDRRAEVNEETLAAPEADALETDWSQRVRKLIEELPARRDRILLKRFYLDEDEKENICKDLGLAPLHFDKIIFRARQRIKALFEARGLKPGDFLSFLVPFVAA
jgi:RNA polymerase sigma-70 factor (ECF subfamily)